MRVSRISRLLNHQTSAQKLITLRKLDRNDLLAVAKWAMDERITPFVLWPAYKNFSDLESYLKEKVEPHPWYKAIVYKDEVVGSITLDRDETNSKSAELGYVIAFDYWNKGIGTAAVGEALKKGFQDLNLEEIVAYTDPENIGSIRVCEKNGMTCRCRLEKYVSQHGVMKDRLLFFKRKPQ